MIDDEDQPWLKGAVRFDPPLTVEMFLEEQQCGHSVDQDDLS